VPAATFAEARDLFLRTRRPSEGKPLARATRLYAYSMDSFHGWSCTRRFAHFAVRLRRTDILTILPNDTIIFNTGGLYTRVTLSRMAKLADPISVLSESAHA